MREITTEHIFEFHGFVRDIPDEITYDTFRGLVQAIYGMTPHDSSDAAAAKWAIEKAVALVPQLRREAKEL